MKLVPRAAAARVRGCSVGRSGIAGDSRRGRGREWRLVALAEYVGQRQQAAHKKGDENDEEDGKGKTVAFHENLQRA